MGKYDIVLWVVTEEGLRTGQVVKMLTLMKHDNYKPLGVASSSSYAAYGFVANGAYSYPTREVLDIVRPILDAWSVEVTENEYELSDGKMLYVGTDLPPIDKYIIYRGIKAAIQNKDEAIPILTMLISSKEGEVSRNDEISIHGLSDSEKEEVLREFEKLKKKYSLITSEDIESGNKFLVANQNGTETIYIIDKVSENYVCFIEHTKGIFNINTTPKDDFIQLLNDSFAIEIDGAELLPRKKFDMEEYDKENPG
ncbi:MAG: hypothetical protein ACRC5C_03385, partial [Bacilli bacterium]